MAEDPNYRLMTLLRLKEECREVEEKRRNIEMQLEQLRCIWFDPMTSRRSKSWDEINEVIHRDLDRAKIEYFDRNPPVQPRRTGEERSETC